jgi:hypothetical protein
MYLLKHATSEQGAPVIVLLKQDSEERLVAWLDKQPEEGLENYWLANNVPSGAVLHCGVD